jgi:hypothetical protein
MFSVRNTFSWFTSLLLLVGYHAKATVVPSVGLDGAGNRHVALADNPQPGPFQPPDTDGSGGHH